MRVIESSRLFTYLTPADFVALKPVVQIREFAAGDVVFKEGDRGDGMYMVREGMVQITAIVGQERKILARLAASEYFGEMAVVDNDPRSASAIMETPGSLYFIPREAVMDLLSRAPRMAITLVREFSQRMRESNKQYVQEVLQAERLTLVGRFARTIVHDFKNPLNVIGLSAEMAGMETATPVMRQNAVQRIRKQVDRLSNMISELLEFTRGNQVAVVLSTVNYGSFVRGIVDELSPEAAEKSVRLVLEQEPPDVNLPIDPQRLTHVFFNLVHNAMDAMQGGGTITLRFAVGYNEVTTELEDTGKGIPSEVASRLFQPFATFGKSKGTGLGLSICKRIVEDHRGTILVKSLPGRGACFSFTLPRSVAST